MSVNMITADVKTLNAKPSLTEVNKHAELGESAGKPTEVLLVFLTADVEYEQSSKTGPTTTEIQNSRMSQGECVCRRAFASSLTVSLELGGALLLSTFD